MKHLKPTMLLLCALLWAAPALGWAPKRLAKPKPATAARKSSAKAKPNKHAAVAPRRGKAVASRQKPVRGKSHATASKRYSYVPPPMHHLTVPFAVHPAPDPILTPQPAPVAADLPPGPTRPFLYAEQLNPFFKSLNELQPSTPQDSPLTTYPGQRANLRILQFGDSHTAADIFTGAVRAQLQATFGNGGLGFQYPGHPFPGYHLAGSARAQSGGWLTEGNKFTQLGTGDLGLGGISISTGHAGEYVTLTTTCTSLQVEFLKQSGGGRLRFVDNGVTVADLDTALEDPGGDSAGTYNYSCSPGTHDFQLSTLDSAPVKLLGWVTEQPGLTYECLGINGAVATLMLRWNQALFAEYLRQRTPDLIVLAYGTNEAVYIASHSDEYLAQFERLLQNLHRLAPQAAVLVLGPYDRATRIGRGRRASWATFYGTERMIEVQKLACRQSGCAFYDQQARMGGPGAMIRWASEGRGQGAHPHLPGAGYRTMADALVRDLTQAYKTYQQTPSTRN